MSNRNWKGSRLRCLKLTDLEPEDFVNMINNLINLSNVKVYPDEIIFYPIGYSAHNEIKLGSQNKLLNSSIRRKLNKWWLNIDCDSEKQTPNWDCVCSAKIDNMDGLILIEAKAHEYELLKKDSSRAVGESLKSIINALMIAEQELNTVESGFLLSHLDYYQISNRFAWSWKLASMGIPVVLIYLGFLNAVEMSRSKILKTDKQWNDCVRKYSIGKIPDAIWESEVHIGDTNFYPIIRSLGI